ncbi:MAG: transcription elongation factor GreA [Parcubacteria group bacterium Gr01-1014_30]|nr:MAG: transcription elongation factor GreA [Parcubacteria group bacterium Gr01-1014_30]
MTQYLTKEGLEKLKQELDNLKNVKRRELAETLRHAASFGDLRENFGYQQAKEDQGFLEQRIRELESRIVQARIIKKQATDKAQVGSTVTLETNKEKQTFQIVGREEANPLQGKISFESPLGQAILSKKAGAKVKVETPEGKTEYKVVKIE